jgi:hypothetical protein
MLEMAKMVTTNFKSFFSFLGRGNKNLLLVYQQVEGISYSYLIGKNVFIVSDEDQIK